MLPINTRSEEPERVFFLGQIRASVRQGKAQVFVLFKIILNLCGCGTGRSHRGSRNKSVDSRPSLHAATPKSQHENAIASPDASSNLHTRQFAGMSTTHSLRDESYVLINTRDRSYRQRKGGLQFLHQRRCLSLLPSIESQQSQSVLLFRGSDNPISHR